MPGPGIRGRTSRARPPLAAMAVRTGRGVELWLARTATSTDDVRVLENGCQRRLRAVHHEQKRRLREGGS